MKTDFIFFPDILLIDEILEIKIFVIFSFAIRKILMHLLL